MSSWDYAALIGAALGGNAVLLLAVECLVKSLISHYLTRDVDKYRAELQAASDTAIERLRHDLGMTATEREIRFRILHEKVADVVATTYERLWHAYQALGSYTAVLEFEGEPNKEEKLKTFSDALNEFRRYFFPRQIFFPRPITDKIKELNRLLHEGASDYTAGLQFAEWKYPGDAVVERFQEAAKKAGAEVPALLDQLYDEFQELIGATQQPVDEG